MLVTLSFQNPPPPMMSESVRQLLRPEINTRVTHAKPLKKSFIYKRYIPRSFHGPTADFCAPGHCGEGGCLAMLVREMGDVTPVFGGKFEQLYVIWLRGRELSVF